MIFLCHWNCHFCLTILSHGTLTALVAKNCRGFNDSKYYVTVSHEKIGHIKCLCYVFQPSKWCQMRVFITTFALRFWSPFSLIKKLFVRDVEDSRCRNKVNKCLWICFCFMKRARKRDVLGTLNYKWRIWFDSATLMNTETKNKCRNQERNGWYRQMVESAW